MVADNTNHGIILSSEIKQYYKMKISRPVFLVFLTLAFPNLQSFAQTLNTAKLDSLFNTLASKKLAMGSVAISKNGVLLYKKAIGYSYIDHLIITPASTQTKYKIGSESKMFTAVMIFQLIEEGKLGLDQKLANWFPQLPNAGRITIRMLLLHRSGLHNYTADDTHFQEWMDKPTTHEQLLKIIQDKGPDFEPDAKASYCNTNYLLLSYIIEKLDNTPYANALVKRIISKIGLRNTYYGEHVKANSNESASYKNDNNTWKEQKVTYPGIHSGAGSIVSCPSDMVKFAESLFDSKLVSSKSLDTMKTMVDGYGMGMFPFGYNGYGHDGRIEEFYSALRYYPAEKLAISYITNGIIYPRIDILVGIEKICFNEYYTVPFSAPIHLSTEDLDKYTGKYASGDIPIQVNCTKDNTKLLLETKGVVFEITPVAANYFMHVPTGTFFEFFPASGELQVKETDNVYYLKKEK